jgi:cerevisin
VDTAVTSLTSAGVHVVAAAGGSGTDAGNTSPGRVPSAITVGASNILDERAPFSSYGSVIDIFAPGVGIISDWIGSPNATNSLSGTSMSAAYIAGLTAYLISVGGNRTPADLSTYMKNLSTKNALSGIREFMCRNV